MRRRLIFIGTFLFTLIALYLLGSYYVVKTVEVYGTSDLNNIRMLNGMSMFTFNERRIEEIIKTENAHVDTAKVTKVWPNKLDIFVTERMPTARVEIADGALLVSARGQVLEKLKTDEGSQVPRIQYYQPLYFNQFTIGRPIEQDEILASLRFLQLVSEFGIDVTTIDILNENMIVLLTDEFDIRIASVKDIDEQFEDFSYTYEQLSLQGASYSRIDVRFEKPVISLNE